jgi:uncharacterized membrane protein
MYDIFVLYCSGFSEVNQWGHMMWPGFPLLGVGLIGLFVVLLFVVIFIVLFGGKKDYTEVMSDARKLLDERYVKGEITQKEYRKYIEDLKK